MKSSNGHQSGRVIAVLASLVVFGLSAPIAHAVPVFFDFSGTCTINCGLLGLNAGDAVSGFFETDDALLVDNAVNTGDVLDFQFTLGNITLDDAFFDFVITSNLMLNPAMDGFNSGLIAIWDTFATSVFAEFELLNAWAYVNLLPLGSALGGGEFSRRVVAAPEPAIVLLLGIGLIGLTGLSRRLSK